MKKYWKLIVGVVAFVAFMVVVSVVYKNLSTEYKPQQNLVAKETPSPQNTDVSQETDAPKETTKPQDTDAPMEPEITQDTDAPKEPENLAPDFTVENAEGEEVSLHDYFGKPIVLNFWASWCGPCKMELPDFQEAYEKYGEEITFLMVNMTDGMQETKEIAMKYMEDAGYTLPVYYDTAQDAAYTYAVYSLPTTFFISAEGEPVAYAQGMIDAETLEKGISMIYP